MEFNPDHWHEFFVMVGGGAAVLTGLVFIAMSLNLKEVLADAAHRSRAVSTLSGFSLAFILAGLALMGNQPGWALGVEWLLVAAADSFIYVRGYVATVRELGGSGTVRKDRLYLGTACQLAQMGGSIAFLMGHPEGLFIAGIGLMASFAVMISGAWMLLAVICSEEEERVAALSPKGPEPNQPATQ